MSFIHTQLGSLKAIVFVLLAGLLFSIADSCAKWLGEQYNIHYVLLLASAVGFTCIASYIFCHRGWAGFKPRKSLKLHLARAAILSVGSYLIVYSLANTTIADFYAIIFCVPLLVSAGAALFFKERAGIANWGAILIGFAGMITAANPDFKNLDIGLITSILAAFCVCSALLIVRKIGRGEYGPMFPLFSNIAIMIVNLPLALPYFESITWFDFSLWLVYGVSISTAVILVSLAYSEVRQAAILGPFSYIQILWGVLIGLFIFNEIPTLNVIAGLIVITLAGLLMTWLEYRNVRKNTAPPVITEGV